MSAANPGGIGQAHSFSIRIGLVLVLLLGATFSAAKLLAQTRLPWHGYIQTRFIENFNDVSSFRIRRAKLWLKGQVPIKGRWFYKVQAIFREKNSGGFTLQDIYAEYDYRVLQVKMGQMVPDFSLQRSQPDYLIPVVERGAAIRNLIPSAETGARDIGVQLTLRSPDHRWHTSVGMFNGNGGNHLRNEDRQFLFTHRTTYTVPLPNRLKGHLGYSLAYRKTDGLAFKKIYGSSAAFVGDDFRWGVEMRLTHPLWEVQAEFIRSNLENDNAWAYYVLTDYNFTPKNQFVFSVDKYRDLNPATDNHPWYIVGFNHYFAGNTAKIMLDTRVQFTNTETNYQTIIQLQLMFNPKNKEK